MHRTGFPWGGRAGDPPGDRPRPFLLDFDQQAIDHAANVYERLKQEGVPLRGMGDVVVFALTFTHNVLFDLDDITVAEDDE